MILTNEFIMMVGLSGSGKSTFASKYDVRNSHLDTRRISTDLIRARICGDDKDQSRNNEVFEIAHKKIIDSLKSNYNVIFDATNLTIKDRRSILQKIKNMPCTKRCVIMATPIDICRERNNVRDRVVPDDVITRQVNKFEIPFYEEGFDYIDIVVNGNCDYREIKVPDMDQKNPHHQLTLREHSKQVMSNLKTNNLNLTNAAYYHDIGKIYTQSFDENGIAHYYHHANVGAYEMLTHGFWYPKFTGQHDWSLDCLNTLFYINYHMRPFDWTSDKTREKYRDIFGAIKFENLLLLHEADKAAQGGK